MCFLLAWNTRLEAKAMVETLSHQRMGTWERDERSSLNKIRSQANSAVVVASAWYSALVERATVVCFLEDQEIGLEPRKTKNPVVEFLSEGSLAQSASVKVDRVRRLGGKWIPLMKVPRMYLRTLLVASKWVVVGVCINSHNRWTLKAKLGRANVRYCKALTMLLHSIELESTISL